MESTAKGYNLAANQASVHLLDQVLVSRLESVAQVSTFNDLISKLLYNESTTMFFDILQFK